MSHRILISIKGSLVKSHTHMPGCLLYLPRGFVSPKTSCLPLKSSSRVSTSRTSGATMKVVFCHATLRGRFSPQIGAKREWTCQFWAWLVPVDCDLPRATVQLLLASKGTVQACPFPHAEADCHPTVKIVLCRIVALNPRRGTCSSKIWL